MEITLDLIDKRISDLSAAYDAQVERLQNIAGAIQEMKHMRGYVENEQKKAETEAALKNKKKGGK